MKAAVIEQVRQPMVIKDVPDPSVGAQDALIRIEAAGVCHTDLHLADGDFAALGIDPFPVIMGHEIVGTVQEVGAGVSHVQPGDRVGAYWSFGCGHCEYCLTGKEQICITGGPNPTLGIVMDGGYAEYISIPADYAVPLPDELDFVHAAPFLCAGITTYGGFKNADLRAGQRAAVLGIGGLGHMALSIANAMGAEVIAITSTKEKEEEALALGAHHVISATGEEAGRKLLDMGGADVVLSTTLDPESIAGVFQGIRPHGTLALLGLTAEPLPVIPAFMILSERRIVGSVIGSRPDTQELLQLAAKHQIRPKTETYRLDDANKAHDRLRAGQVRYRAVLTPH